MDFERSFRFHSYILSHQLYIETNKLLHKFFKNENLINNNNLTDAPLNFFDYIPYIRSEFICNFIVILKFFIDLITKLMCSTTCSMNKKYYCQNFQTTNCLAQNVKLEPYKTQNEL